MRRLPVAIVYGALVALAVAPARGAEREWVVARSPNFVVVSDAGERKARQVAHQFEQVRSLFAQVSQARVEPGRLVLIYAVRDEAGLRELLPGAWEARNAARPAGVFIAGRDKHLVALRLDVGGEFPYRVIYHEYAHLLTRLNARWVPLWLNEGLAEFYGTADVDEEEVRWGRMFPSYVLYLRQGTALKLEELFSADQNSSAYGHEDRTPAFYAQSAVLTHYLLLGAPARRGQLREFLKQLDSGLDEPQARARAFGDMGKLQGEVDRYVRRSMFQAFKAPARVDAQAIRASSLTGPRADALRGDFLVRTGRRDEARPLLEGALRQDPAFYLVHEAMGVLAESEGRPSEALSQFIEAFRLAPDNYVALFRAGLIGDAAAPPEKDVARREQFLRRAVLANPAFAPALASLAELLASRDGQEAVSLARQACALDPASTSQRFTLVRVLRSAGQADEAASVEAELLRQAQRDPGALAQLVDQLESDDRPGDAERLLRETFGANRRSATLALILGAFLQERGRAGEAEAILREACAADPQSLNLANSLAYALAEQPDKAAEGLMLIDKVLKKAADEPAYLDTRGWALFHLERLAEAESVLRLAARGSPSGVILDHLGDVVRRRGAPQDAMELYERALAASDLSTRRRAELSAKLDALRGAASRPDDHTGAPK